MLHLDTNNIKYETQKTFNGCRNLNLLKFDFYLNEYDLLIEFDGIQHFVPFDFFGGIEAFEKTTMRDEIKNKWCSDNNKMLLRIPYFEIYNIPNILDEKISELK